MYGSRFLAGLSGKLSENMEQSAPAHFPGMNQRSEVCSKPFTNMAGLPHFFRRVDRHVDDQGCADNILPWHKAPETAVVGIVAVVAHHEILSWRNYQLAIHHMRVDLRLPLWTQTPAPFHIVRCGRKILSWHIHRTK